LIDSEKLIENTAQNLSFGELDSLKIEKRGDNDKILESLKKSVDSIRFLVKGIKEYAKHSNSGELEKINLDENRVEGAYREIFEQLNSAAKATAEPIYEVLEIMRNLENSDFTNYVEGDYKGTFFELKSAVNSTIEAISSVLSQVTTATSQVMSGAQQVADASQSLSQGATEQAASLEEISASMQEINNQTKVNAESASKANKLSVEAKKSAQKGNVEMGELMSAVTEISQSRRDLKNYQSY